MATAYPVENIWDRKKWQTERDKEKVPKGAAKVSMGDEIEKFHKANAKGLREGRAAAEKLLTVVAAYKKAIAAKHDKLAKRIDKMLVYFLNQYLKDTKGIIDAIPHYTSFHKAASETLSESARQVLEWDKQGGQGKFKPTNADATKTALSNLLTCSQRMVYVSAAVKKDVTDALDKAVYGIDGGASWKKSTVMAVVDLVAKLPSKV